MKRRLLKPEPRALSKQNPVGCVLILTALAVVVGVTIALTRWLLCPC